MGSNYDNEPTLGYIGTSQEQCHPTNILWTDKPWNGRVLFTGEKNRFQIGFSAVAMKYIGHSDDTILCHMHILHCISNSWLKHDLYIYHSPVYCRPRPYQSFDRENYRSFLSF